VALSDYKRALMVEAAEMGTPVIRPLFLHFPNDEVARKQDSSFMLGENILMAPYFGASEWGEESRDVYLPGPATWTYLWHGTKYHVEQEGQLLVNFKTPIGQPAVFYRDTARTQMSSILSNFQNDVKIGIKKF